MDDEGCGCTTFVLAAVVAVGCSGWLITQYLRTAWLILTAVGPDVILGLTVVGTALGPVLFLRVLLERFGKPGWRMLLFVPVVALVTLVAADLGWVAALFVDAVLHPVLSEQLLPWLEVAARQDLIGSWLGDRLDLARPDVLSRLAVTATLQVACLPPLLLAARGLSTAPADPVLPPYAFSEAWQDLRAVLTRPFDLLMKALGWWLGKAVWLVRGFRAILTWPLALLMVGGAVIPVAMVFAQTLVLSVLFGAVVAVLWTVMAWTALVLHLAERSVLLVRGRFAVCPHTGCHARVPLPLFSCPSCGRLHRDLIPGRQGVLTRTCACGRRLPTLYALGKGRLKARCSQCARPMPEALFGGVSRVVLVGGPSSGKTMALTGAVWQLVEQAPPGLRARLLSDENRRQWVARWEPDFTAGRRRDKTQAEDPTAFLLSLRRGVGLPTSLYLYDPAGEATLTGEGLERMRFLDDTDGIALVVDPLTLPGVRRGTDPTQLSSASSEETGEALDRLVNHLETSGRLPARREGRIPVAVLLTKADHPAVRGLLPAGPTSDEAHGDWLSAGQASSEALRSWLSEQAWPLVATLDDRFARVRYFAVSAQGHPDEGRAFQPRGLLAPVQWLLGRSPWLRWPVWTRGLLLGAEVVAALGVVGLLLGGPVGLLWWGAGGVSPPDDGESEKQRQTEWAPPPRLTMPRAPIG